MAADSGPTFPSSWEMPSTDLLGIPQSCRDLLRSEKRPWAPPSSQWRSVVGGLVLMFGHGHDGLQVISWPEVADKPSA